VVVDAKLAATEHAQEFPVESLLLPDLQRRATLLASCLARARLADRGQVRVLVLEVLVLRLLLKCLALQEELARDPIVLVAAGGELLLLDEDAIGSAAGDFAL